MSFSVTRDGITVTGEKMTDVFRQLADLQEVFGIDSCGKCGNADIRYITRIAKDKKGKDHEYFEMRCNDRSCRARLTFGKNLEGGGIFPHRKDDAGEWLPDNGWIRWDKEKQKEV
jgi:hypothetical protein